MLKPLRFILLCWLLLPIIVMANSNLNLSIGQWSFDELNANNLNIDISLTAKGIGFTASADNVMLAEPIGIISKVMLKCSELLLVSESYSCARGTINFHQQDLGEQTLIFKFEAHPENKIYKLEIDDLSIASALFSITFILKNKHWQMFADTPQIQLSSLRHFLEPHMQTEQLESLTNWRIAGELKLDIDLKGQAEQLNDIELDVVSNDINVSDSQGLYVSEGLANILSFDAKRIKQDWQWDMELSIEQGQGYADPVFIDFIETPLSVQANGEWLNVDSSLEIRRIKVKHGGVTQLHGDLTANLTGITSLNMTMEKSQLADLYSIWIQPFTLGTAIANLNLAGDMTAQFQQDKGQYQLRIHLNDAFIHEQEGLFSVDGLSGDLAWTNYEHPIESELHWRSGSIYALSLGESTIKTQVKSSSLLLLKPWILPILDGELHLNNFSFNHLPDMTSTWTFDGELMPISMESLSTTLAWPLLHGQLSGVIPNVAYADHKIKINGALKVNLFEGDTVIRDLELIHPFGSLPELKANISFKGLNLETLTQTFDFGKITGKLDGKATNLRLLNWDPVEFNASFSTPEDDKSRRRISQKAVDNLSQIGGGATGILQRSFLRFFEDFSYQRLGLNCRLQNDVCEMSGVAEADEGYYIVKGGGFPPRINVVGYTRRVNWSDLIERLKAVSESSATPVIK